LPEFVDGLPLHALLVHFVVVMLPLAVLGAIVIAVWPAARRRFGWLVVAVAGAGALLVPFAANSGENLASRFPPDELIARHQELGESLIWWAVPLFIVVLGFMVLHTRLDRPTEESGGGVAVTTKTGTTVITIVAAVLTVGIAVGTGIQTYRVGDAGSRSVWGDIENLPTQNGG
jgi:membrane associated rhomboid family serine protease